MLKTQRLYLKERFVDLNKETLSERDTNRIIAGWDVMKPTEPDDTDEPLFVWPTKLGPRYFIRVFIYKRKLKATWWGFYYEQYQTWRVFINRHYNALAGDRDRYADPQLMRLWDYQQAAQSHGSEKSIQQADWDKQKSDRRKAEKQP